jgi:hypothetical protein
VNTHAVNPAKGLLEWVLESFGRACDRIDKEAERIEEYADRQPARALCLALGAGLLVGLLVKRW